MDFNLSTGKLVYTKEVESTDDPYNGNSEKEIHIKKGLKINLENRNNEDRKIILPKTKREVYI
ncbi:hypothetical protein [Chryseobacterium sp.]|uniref:hypothetical protein n=1 Tax=Chryseobacterium sp. TaxID=1871047 RepID=UPI0025BB1C7D|nr:hypothetical protein [Chryseobacterium sp.]